MSAELSKLLKVAREETRKWSQRQRRAGLPGGQVRVLAYVLEAQDRGVFHPHVILGYKTAGDRAALDVFRGALKRARGEYGFGRGRSGFDAGKPGWFAHAGQAASYISKYLRMDGRKSSIVPLLAEVERRTPKRGVIGGDGRTRWLAERLLRPVYVSPLLTKITGETGRRQRFRRWLFKTWGGEQAVPADIEALAWAVHTKFGLVPAEGAWAMVPRPPSDRPWDFEHRADRLMPIAPRNWGDIARERNGLRGRRSRDAMRVAPVAHPALEEWPF